MKKEKLICTKVLKTIGIYLITSFFTKFFLNINKNTSSNSILSFFFNKEWKTYFLSALHYTKITKYLCLSSRNFF